MGGHEFFEHSEVNQVANLIEGSDLADVLPPWHLDLFSFLLLFLFFLLLSLLLLELYPQVGQFQLNHVIHHLLHLFLYLRQHFFLDLFHLGLVLCTCLVLPLVRVLFNVLLHH